MHEMQKIQAQSLGWEDPLGESMATQFSILMDSPGGLQSMRSQSVRHD